MSVVKFSGKGGEKYDADLFTEAILRAELVELVHGCCLEHGAIAVDKILAEYTVAPKRPGLARHITPVAPSPRP
jgi:hypothetical protein